MPAASKIKECFTLVPGLVGVVLFLGLIVNASTKRDMCRDTGRSFEAAQVLALFKTVS